MTEQGELERALDSIVERFGSGAHQAEVVRGRETYQERTGRVFEDDELYEARTNAFLEWYVLERPLDGVGAAPVVVALREDPASPHAEAWRALARSHRSIFAVRELAVGGPDEPGSVLLVDLVGGATFRVAERRRLHGVAEGDPITARVVGYRGEVRFGRTFCYHPARAREAIVGHCRRIRAAGGSRADAVDYVASLRVRCERYRHVSPERVYEAATSEFPVGRE